MLHRSFNRFSTRGKGSLKSSQMYCSSICPVNSNASFKGRLSESSSGLISPHLQKALLPSSRRSHCAALVRPSRVRSSSNRTVAKLRHKHMLTMRDATLASQLRLAHLLRWNALLPWRSVEFYRLWYRVGRSWAKQTGQRHHS